MVGIKTVAGCAPDLWLEYSRACAISSQINCRQRRLDNQQAHRCNWSIIRYRGMGDNHVTERKIILQCYSCRYESGSYADLTQFFNGNRRIEPFRFQ